MLKLLRLDSNVRSTMDELLNTQLLTDGKLSLERAKLVQHYKDLHLREAERADQL